MRALQVFTVTLCTLAGAWLLLYAPPFFMPDRWNPAVGYQLDALSARLLGAGLLGIAAAGMGFLRQRYYGGDTARPTLAWQYRHFALLLAAMLLIGAAFVRATPGPNPEHRAAAAQQDFPARPA